MLAIQFRKVVRPFLPVGFTGGEHVIVDDQNTVADRNSSPFVATPCRNLMILGRQVGVLRSSCGLGSLNQNGFDPPIAFADPSTESFAATLIVARADPLCWLLVVSVHQIET